MITYNLTAVYAERTTVDFLHKKEVFMKLTGSSIEAFMVDCKPKDKRHAISALLWRFRQLKSFSRARPWMLCSRADWPVNKPRVQLRHKSGGLCDDVARRWVNTSVHSRQYEPEKRRTPPSRVVRTRRRASSAVTVKVNRERIGRGARLAGCSEQNNRQRRDTTCLN